MALEYVKLSNKDYPNNGIYYLQTAVFEEIVSNTITSLENIHFEGGAYNYLLGKAGPLKVTIKENNQIVIDVNIEINYGANIDKTIHLAQSEICRSIGEMTGIKNAKVNINLNKIIF